LGLEGNVNMHAHFPVRLSSLHAEPCILLFRKLRTIIKQIDKEGFHQPDELSSPMHQRPSRNRVRYIRGLVHEVEKLLRQ